ncbi:MAG: dinitrogenase iron-molybdenum cofactor biosynthesis protein [Archaeoglobus sp.]|jgi:predicted Fe-Mo cluster-binding NifX family protein|nr:MAG: dinitrogenase iron-molybdenum cofactor biosynthesis protein [Archaeoglobus sp.]
MKIAVPTEGRGGLNDLVSMHFGRAATFTVYDTETKEEYVIPNTSEHFGGVGTPPELLAKAGVDVVVCGNLGPKAVLAFERFGIKVYVGATGTAKDAINAFLSGILQPASLDTACPDHRHPFF